jgi:hypothetical protein
MQSTWRKLSLLFPTKLNPKFKSDPTIKPEPEILTLEENLSQLNLKRKLAAADLLMTDYILAIN